MQPTTALPPLSKVIWSVCLINQKSEVASSTIYPKATSKMFDKGVVREATDFERIKGLEFRDSLGPLAGHNVDFYRGVIGIWERFLATWKLKGRRGGSRRTREDCRVMSAYG